MGTGPRGHDGPTLPLRGTPARLFWVTDVGIVGQDDFVERAHTALEVGGSISALQLRAHELSGRKFYELATTLREAARATGAQLWINDRLDIALTVRADGVQLGERSIPTAQARRLLGARPWLGRSCHDPQEAGSAVHDGADLAVLGHIYSTPSHHGQRPLGLDVLRRAVVTTGGRVVAIGGISPDRARRVVDTGAWGVAVRRGIWEVDSTRHAAEAYRASVESTSPPVPRQP